MAGVGVAARAPHPHAALLWYEFELSDEAQNLFAECGFTPTSRKVATSVERVPLRFIDPRMILDDGDKWDKRFAEIFGGQKQEK